MISVGIWFPRALNSVHWPSLRLASAWLSGNNFVLPSSVIVAVNLSCFIALAIVDLPVSITFSRSMLLDSGASSRLLVGWCWIVDVNPILSIKGHVNPRVPLSSGSFELSSILHVAPGIELSFPVWVWPACRYSLTAFLGNVSAVSKCILSCLSGAMSLAPCFAFSIVNFFLALFPMSPRNEVKLVVPFAREG